MPSGFSVRVIINGKWYTEHRRGEIRKLKKIGAYTWRAGKSKLKKRKGSAADGAAPHTHGRKLSGAVRFAVDERSMSVVTGPETGSSRVAQVIERGGMTTITSGPRTGQRYHAAPHPWMVPAQLETHPAIARIIGE